MGGAQSADKEPEFTCSINSTRTVASGYLSHIAYCIQLQRSGASWVVWRRYSEFVQLRLELMPTVVAARQPLPPKHGGLHGASSDVVRERMPALEAWLGRLLQDEPAMRHLALLEFLGLAGQEFRGGQPASMEMRDANRGTPPVTMGRLSTMVETGDMLLMRTRAPGPRMQRALTRSEWDHIGMIVHTDANGYVCWAATSHRCRMIHAASDGCSLYDVGAFMRDYEEYDEVVLRQLHWEGRGTERGAYLIGQVTSRVCVRGSHHLFGRFTVSHNLNT